MPNWDMDVYIASAGVEMTISCGDEGAYDKAREYLTKIGADCGPPAPGRKKPEFFTCRTGNSSEPCWIY